MLRIATFGGVQPAALVELTDVLNDMLSGQGAKRSKMGGVRTAAEILNLMNSTAEDAVVASMRALAPDLAKRIVDETFLFENLDDVEEGALPMILKRIDPDSLTISLKGSTDKLRAKYLKKIPK